MESAQAAVEAALSPPGANLLEVCIGDVTVVAGQSLPVAPGQGQATYAWYVKWNKCGRRTSIAGDGILQQDFRIVPLAMNMHWKCPAHG